MRLLPESGVLSVKGKILMAVFLLNVMFMAGGAVTLYRFSRAMDLNNEMIDEFVFSVHHAHLLTYSLVDMDEAFTLSRLRRQALDADVLDSKVDAIFQEISILRQTHLGPVEKDILSNVEVNVELYTDILKSANSERAASPRSGLWSSPVNSEALLSTIRSDIDKFLALNHSQLDGTEKALRRYYRNSFIMGLVILTISLFFTALISVVLVTTIIVPIRRLVDWLNRYKANPEMRIERLGALRADELGFLTDSFYDLLNEFFLQKERFRQQTLTDELTGLYNYRYFKNFIAQQLAHMERHRRHLALAIVDIDHFKHFNDTNGHPMGNVVLKDMALLLKSQIREGDFVARYGGEEFVMVFPETTRNAAVHLCERIRETVARSEFAGSKNQPGGRLTISVGLAFYPESAKIPKLLLEMADRALYEAKHRGRNCVVADHPAGH